MSCKQIISGEASESDDEHHYPTSSPSGNINKIFCDNVQRNKNVKYSYEIAEDALAKDSILSCVEDNNRKFNLIDLQNKSDYDSLLRKNLVEINTSFWFSINHMIQNKIAILSRQLLSADQLLLKSQVTLQSIGLNLKNVNTTTTDILNKTNDIVNNSNFIPDATLKE